jgi:hypothetical protein
MKPAFNRTTGVFLLPAALASRSVRAATGRAAPLSRTALGAAGARGHPRSRIPGLRPAPVPRGRFRRASGAGARLFALRHFRGVDGGGRRPGAGRAAAAFALADHGRREGADATHPACARVKSRGRRPLGRFGIAPPPIRPASTATARAAWRLRRYCQLVGRRL